MTAALSEYATTVPWGFAACVVRTMPNSGVRLGRAVDDPRRVEILCRQCSEFACANIVELDVGGVAPASGEVGDQVVDLVWREGEAERGVRPLDGVTAAAQDVHRGEGLGGRW